MLRSLVTYCLVVLLLLSGVVRASAAPAELVGAGKIYARVTNPASARINFAPRIYFNPNLDPWLGDTVYATVAGVQKAAPSKELWLKPGEKSAWVDIGEHMSTHPSFRAKSEYLAPVFVAALSSPVQDGLNLIVEIAAGTQHRLLRQIQVRTPQQIKLGNSVWLGGEPLPTLGLLVPTVAPYKTRIYTLEEAAKQQLTWINSYGPKPTLSTHIWFIAGQAFADQPGTSPLREMQSEILRRLGYANSVQYAADEKDLERLRSLNAGPFQTRLEQPEDDEAAAAARLRKSGLLPYVRAVTLGDEIDIEVDKAKEKAVNTAFVANLKSRGFHPDDFVLPEFASKAATLPEEDRWSLVKFRGPLPASRPKLFFEAAMFRYREWSKDLATKTKQVQANFPIGVQTGANFSPHLSVWPDVRKWIDPFRDGAMTMPWSEDWWWQVPEAGPQAYGYLLDALRHAADYHDAPYCFYTIPDNGETASNLLRMNYFALGHQAKVIDHFAIYHQAFGTCDYIDFLESKEKYRSIHRILSDVGQVDARLAAARMRKAQIAIMMPVANDVWNNEDLLSDPKQEHTNNLYYADLNVENHERKALWLALRHAGYSVDLITDEDVAAGKLSDYRVLYLVGQEMSSAAVSPLKSWVAKGGVLVAESGGGVLNEYREAQQGMLSLYGLKASHLVRKIRTLQPADDLPDMKPLGRIVVDGSSLIPAFCSAEELEPVDPSNILAHWENGKAAIITHAVGEGMAISCGALAGLAYIQPALKDKPQLLFAYPRQIGELISQPVSNARQVLRPILCSEPLVDATLQEGPLGAVITLTDFRMDARKPVTISLPGLSHVKSVRSIRHGNLLVKQTPAGSTVTLPLDIGDFLLPN